MADKLLIKKPVDFNNQEVFNFPSLPNYVNTTEEQNITGEKKFDARPQLNSSLVVKTRSNVLPPYVDLITLEDIPSAGFEDILEGIVGKTKVEWNALNASEYGSNSTYNGETLVPVMLESSSSFWNSASGRPLDVSFHFAKKEKMATLQVKCPPYGGVSPTMTVYYAQEGDTELTLYREIATISTGDRKTYEFNEEGISADYWVVRFTASGWIDLRLCKPGSSFTPGLYSEVFHQQIMDKLNGYQPVGNYALKSELPSKVSQLTNDSNFITSSYHDATKQDTLVSGTSIKTINGESILGSGNIVIQGGSAPTNMVTTDTDQTIDSIKMFKDRIEFYNSDYISSHSSIGMVNDGAISVIGNTDVNNSYGSISLLPTISANGKTGLDISYYDTRDRQTSRIRAYTYDFDTNTTYVAFFPKENGTLITREAVGDVIDEYMSSHYDDGNRGSY